jgi:hypothetical protein
MSNNLILIPVCGNDPMDPNNYRGITITGAIGKVFNEVLRLRLDKFLQDHNIIHESQIGSNNLILIPVCITVSKAFFKSTKHANNHPSFELQYLLIRQLITNI